jgi:hypothetical protein|tara:strand:- start:140 stop:646 length:507 start_codon:yes stop_codon:yes gene_type:complete
MKLSQIIFENDEKELALSFKAALDKEMEDGKLDEIAISALGVLTWALASNTVLNMLGKYASKKLKKIGFDKTADKASALQNWAHNNEQNFIRFIGGIISPFVKDVQKRKTVAKGLFLLVLVGLGIKAGVGVAKALKATSASSATVAALKGALKGRDIANIGKELAAAL